MRRGGAASRGQGGIVLWGLLATPACGLVVGFEPRELCDDCSTSTGEANGSGGSNSPSAGGASNAGGVTSTGSSEANGTGAVESAGAVGGSSGNTAGDGSGTDGGGSSSGSSGGTSTGGTDIGGTDAGGTDAGSGGSTTSATDAGNGGVGGTTTDSGGAGGSEAVSNSAGGTEGGGTGGGGASGSGGDTSSTTTTAAGGSTTGGGSGGSGGTGGTPSCDVDEPFNVTEGLGVYPASLVLGRSVSRPWDFTWVAGGNVYVAARRPDRMVALEPMLLDSSGTHSPSVIAAQGVDAFVAYGEFASDEARIVVNQLNPLDPSVVNQIATGVLDADAAPRVVGMVFKGTSNDDWLVASIDEDGNGLLSWFENGAYLDSQPMLGPIDDLVPVDLGTDYAIAFVEGDSLQVAVVPYEFGEIETPVQVSDALPSAPSLGSIAAARTDTGAALVWLEGNGVYLTTFDEDGEAEAKVPVSSGTDMLPRVDARGAGLFVSWIDKTTLTLYLRRFPTGLTGSPEQRIKVDAPVAEVSYGFAVDTLSTDTTVAFVYSTERLRMNIIDCD